ncbi:hypothetical protein CFC21_111748 [Triticum aestivum]|uniref:Cathepsin propeptide inhibitor domain-containing protein n=2 Tax=Triticum aestivum TaxID=4565 RepID=A0A3B6TYZ6_WHEAT|nr:oryzain alpha chain-like isoform X3 [Triticum aestivum]KAF7111781.1 hypothetical protein CFC21_111748 [Triticum aestivum]
MSTSTALMAAASLLLLLVSLAAAADIQMAHRERSEEETRRIFVEWKAKYGRSYDSIREEERRYAIFKDNLLRNIDQQSAAGIERQLNNFSDHTHGGSNLTGASAFKRDATGRPSSGLRCTRVCHTIRKKKKRKPAEMSS